MHLSLSQVHTECTASGLNHKTNEAEKRKRPRECSVNLAVYRNTSPRNVVSSIASI